MKDQVPPFPSETAVSIIEEELGGPVDVVFDRFDYEPIAAASLGNINFLQNSMKTFSSRVSQFVSGKYEMQDADVYLAGQVHRANLKGLEIVCKVQRPGLKDLFDIDLKNLRVSLK